MLAWDSANESPVTDEKLQWPALEVKKRKEKEKGELKKKSTHKNLQWCGPSLGFVFYTQFRYTTAEAVGEHGLDFQGGD